MAKLNLTKFTLYRSRYWIGYGLLAVALLGVLVLAGLFVPGGISDQERATAVTSAHLSLHSIADFAITDMPYHVLQKLSFVLFGVSNISIKLPSLILAFLAAGGMILLLIRWFSQNIAILATLITVTTGQFLFIAQNGTPSISYLVWPIWLLVLATYVAQRVRPQTLWYSLLFIVAALSLYTPLSIYILLAIISAIWVHPHLRFIVRKLSRPQLLIGAIIGLLVLLPLLIHAVLEPSLCLQLLGWKGQGINLGDTMVLLGRQYFDFFKGTSSTFMTPVFGLSSLAIIGYGLYKHIQKRQSSKSYIVIAWIIFLIPALLIDPQNTSVTFVPMLILLATGLNGLLHSWYDIFPLNPYARIAGLLPIIVLVSGMVLVGLERYAYGYSYSPDVASSFSKDLSLLPKSTKHLVVSRSELPFYQTVARYNHQLQVSTTIPLHHSYTVTRTVEPDSHLYGPLERIITSPASQQADRFYVYKNS